MRPRLRECGVLTLAVIAIAGFLAVGIFISLPFWRMHDLRAACLSGDRIVVDTNPYPKDMRAGGPVTPVFEISGAGKVTDLLDAIELERSLNGTSCKCFGDMKIAIFRGKTELAELSIQHEKAVRWSHGGWSGDQPLTTSSRNSLSAFLKANECPTPAESRRVYVTALEAMPQTP